MSSYVCPLLALLALLVPPPPSELIPPYHFSDETRRREKTTPQCHQMDQRSFVYAVCPIICSIVIIKCIELPVSTTLTFSATAAPHTERRQKRRSTKNQLKLQFGMPSSAIFTYTWCARPTMPTPTNIHQTDFKVYTQHLID